MDAVFPWLVAIVALAGTNAWGWYVYQRQVRRLEDQNKELLDRLMVKIPDQYFNLRLNETQMEYDREQPAHEEEMRIPGLMGPQVG